MDLPDAVAHCLSKPGAEEATPFGPEVLVSKVGGKLFALAIPEEVPPRLNLKCEPTRALALRDEHPPPPRLPHEQAALEHPRSRWFVAAVAGPRIDRPLILPRRRRPPNQSTGGAGNVRRESKPSSRAAPAQTASVPPAPVTARSSPRSRPHGKKQCTGGDQWTARDLFLNTAREVFNESGPK